MTANVLYSFRRCPYAIRARWAILNSGITVILREVNLKDKPKELLELSSKGTVPVLLTSSGEVIDESLDIIIWALESSSKANKMTDYKNIDFNLIEENDTKFKYHLDRFKYASRYDKSKSKFHHRESVKILYRWNEKLSESNNNWLIKDHETITDWSLWPFVRQFHIADPAFLQTNDLSNLKAWLYSYLNHPLFNLLMKKSSYWNRNEDLPFIFGDRENQLLN